MKFTKDAKETNDLFTVQDTVCDEIAVFGTDDTEECSSHEEQTIVAASTAKTPPRPSSLQKVFKYSAFKNDGGNPNVKRWVGAFGSTPTLPAPIKRLLTGLLKGKRSHSKGDLPIVNESTQLLQVAPTKSFRVKFHEGVNWEAEKGKEARRKAFEAEMKQIKFQRNETFLFLMLADVNILIKCYHESKSARCLLESLFTYWCCPPETDGLGDLYDRFVAIRSNKRWDPKHLLSYQRRFPRWPDKPRDALWKLQKKCSVFAPENKENTQRRVLYHLKFTIQTSDLIKNQDHEEQQLFRKILSWFFSLANPSARQQCCLSFRLHSIVGIEISCGLAMLRNGDVSFDDLTQEAKSLLLLIGHMSTLQDLFNTTNQTQDAATA